MPILAMPDGHKESVIYSDASNKGLACTLMQNRKVITYVLRQAKLYEENYPT